MAIAARRPMMATTIMISTSVKPALREVLIFITNLCLSIRGVNRAAGGLFIRTNLFTVLPAATAGMTLAIVVPLQSCVNSVDISLIYPQKRTNAPDLHHHQCHTYENITAFVSKLRPLSKR